MSTIGFKTSTVLSNDNAQIAEPQIANAQNIQEIGFIKAVELLQKYLNPYYGPLGVDKDQYYFEKLKKVKERYFDKI